jgi:hypothetical protein
VDEDKAREGGRIRQEEAHACIKRRCFFAFKEMFPSLHETFPKKPRIKREQQKGKREG